ncbi:MAG: hypothetical protein A2V66_06430 [Ignavibacteria bacterium RBG_13_36_8]|nr:MAG: hypothetical protein A2V66_06430 [Ignavibacteria bacterium RBG_13_36_8]
MKSFYYFSKSKLKFVEIRNFYGKFVFLIIFFSILFSFLIFSAYYIVKEIVNPHAEVEALQTENLELTNRLAVLLQQYKNLDEGLDSLIMLNKDIRVAVNLEPLTDEERELGIGGKMFEDIVPASSGDIKSIVTNLNSLVDKLAVKLNFEKNNYNEIKSTLELNEKLYDALPAVKPCEGTFGNSFGMRFHPILKIRRMHTGQDIITGTGTNVYASGGGVIDFVGRRGSLGIAVEIDHGFGYRSVYGHLSEFKVRVGQNVKRGDLIALSGNTGRLSAGPHLHYEVRHNGIALNPRDFIYDEINLFEIISQD